jgi:hypothetical protein
MLINIAVKKQNVIHIVLAGLSSIVKAKKSVTFSIAIVNQKTYVLAFFTMNAK